MMDAEREKARWRRRRLIYNNDGDEAIEARSGVEHENDVSEALKVRPTCLPLLQPQFTDREACGLVRVDWGHGPMLQPTTMAFIRPILPR